LEPGGRARQYKIRRLEYLESLELASELGSGMWKIDDELLKRLGAMAAKRDIIKTMHRKLRGIDPNAGIEIFDKENPPSEPVCGKVLEKGLSDELLDQKYLIVGDGRGKAYYVPLSNSQALSKRDFKIGEEVRVEVTSRSLACKSDHNIAAFCASHGGVYDAEIHEQETRAGAQLPRGVSAAAYVGNHTKRLGSLVRMGLAEELSPSRWRVAGDLLEQLKERHLKSLSVEPVGRDRGLDLQLEIARKLP
jgi:hypothetical protein